MLSDQQQRVFFDLLAEQISDTAHVVSDLVGVSIEMSLSDVSLYSANQLDQLFLPTHQYLMVHQEISGALDAELMFWFDTDVLEHVVTIFKLARASTLVLQPLANEAILEIGNLMLNSAARVCANLLHAPLGSSLPHLHTGTLVSIQEILTTAPETDLWAVVLPVLFRRKVAAEGYMLVACSQRSFERLAQGIMAACTP